MHAWAAIVRGLETQGRAALVTVLEAKGSAPREAGARMVVFPNASFTGTIGGGTLEWRAIAAARGSMEGPAGGESSGPSSALRAPSPPGGEGAGTADSGFGADREGRGGRATSPSPLGGEGGRRPDEGMVEPAGRIRIEERRTRRAQNQRVLPLARHLRSGQTDAEGRLWAELRDRRFMGVKFRRQAPIGRYIADFFCPAAKLIIEADGGQHNESPRDRVRDGWLSAQGFRVLRFWNDEILKDMDMVLEVIWSALDEAGLVGGESSSPSSALRALPGASHASRAVLRTPPRGEGDGAPPLPSSPHSPKQPAPAPSRRPDEGLVEAVETIGPTRFQLLSYALGPQLGQCCGGHVRLAVEVFTVEDLPVARDFAAREARGRFSTEVRIADGRMPRRIVERPDAPVAALEDAVLTESFGEDRRTLLLFGAGHVGRALVLALAPLPFRVIWVDPRPDAFPGAVPQTVTKVRPENPLSVLEAAPDGAFVLVMTHSHAMDLEIVDASLRTTRLPYVGVIGSATKRVRFEKRLSEMGHDDETIGRMVCPIGATGPKSKLPAVIAAATAVELIVADEAVRAKGFWRPGAAGDASAPEPRRRPRLVAGGAA